MEAKTHALVTASHFGQLIDDQDYRRARQLLTAEARSLYSAQSLQTAVETMVSDASGPILQSQVLEETTVEDWPINEPTWRCCRGVSRSWSRSRQPS